MNKKVIIIAIFFIFLVAGLILLNQNPQNPTQLFETSQTSSPQPTAIPTTVTTQTEIGAKVLQFYQEYAQFNAGGLDTLYQKGFLTEDAYNKLKKPQPLDPVLCTQGGSQSPMEIDSVTLNDPEAIVIMKQYYEGSNSYNYIKVAVGIPDQKIMSIMCNYTK